MTVEDAAAAAAADTARRIEELAQRQVSAKVKQDFAAMDSFPFTHYFGQTAPPKGARSPSTEARWMRPAIAHLKADCLEAEDTGTIWHTLVAVKQRTTDDRHQRLLRPLLAAYVLDGRMVARVNWRGSFWTQVRLRHGQRDLSCGVPGCDGVLRFQKFLDRPKLIYSGTGIPGAASVASSNLAREEARGDRAAGTGSLDVAADARINNWAGVGARNSTDGKALIKVFAEAPSGQRPATPAARSYVFLAPVPRKAVVVNELPCFSPMPSSSSSSSDPKPTSQPQIQYVTAETKTKFAEGRESCNDRVCLWPCTCHEACRKGPGKRNHDTRCEKVRWQLGLIPMYPKANDCVQFMATAPRQVAGNWLRCKIALQMKETRGGGGSGKQRAKPKVKWGEPFEMRLSGWKRKSPPPADASEEQAKKKAS